VHVELKAVDRLAGFITLIMNDDLLYSAVQNEKSLLDRVTIESENENHV
jgi:hypothetical protein